MNVSPVITTTRAQGNTAGIELTGGWSSDGPARRNRIQVTSLSQNVVSGNTVGISLTGGEGSGAQQDSVVVAKMDSNALAGNAKPVKILDDNQGAAGNLVIVSGTDGVGEGHNNSPDNYSLSQNFPNPFNSSTTIRYRIPAVSRVILKLYDILGREVKTLVNEQQTAGSYSVTMNAGNFPSGVYFYHLQAGPFTATKELVLLRQSKSAKTKQVSHLDGVGFVHSGDRLGHMNRKV